MEASVQTIIGIEIAKVNVMHTQNMFQLQAQQQVTLSQMEIKSNQQMKCLEANSNQYMKHLKALIMHLVMGGQQPQSSLSSAPQPMENDGMQGK
eukprot:4440789-Ditylum_brightwellii.AAC.1